MHKRVAHLALVLGLAGAGAALSVGCSSDDDSTSTPKGGAGGASGHAGSAGKGGSSGKGGSEEGGNAGEANPAGSAGVDQGGAPGAAGDHGDTAGNGPDGEGGEGGEVQAHAHVYSASQVERGKVIVRSMSLCGGCHTASDVGSLELGGNAKFGNSMLPAPNLTDDPAGIGEWTDAQVMNAFRNGIDDEGRQLASAMPYWLFHNMNDTDALSVVAFLRSLPHSSVAVPAPTSTTLPTAVTPLSPSSFPDTTLPTAAPAYAEAQKGKYLVSGVAQCVRCHSPADALRIPVADFFSGVPPVPTTANPNPIFASNLTPDATGLENWSAADVATALKTGVNRAGVTLCGSMPSAAKGYGGMTDADAHAIGVYLTTIPPISKPAAAPGLEPACPVTP